MGRAQKRIALFLTVLFSMVTITPASADMGMMTDDQIHEVWVQDTVEIIKRRTKLQDEFLDEAIRLLFERSQNKDLRSLWLLSLLDNNPRLYWNWNGFEGSLIRYELSARAGDYGVALRFDTTQDLSSNPIAYCDEDGIPPLNCQGCVGLGYLEVDDLHVTTVNEESLIIDISREENEYNSSAIVKTRMGRIEMDLLSMDTDIELGPTEDLGQQLGTLHMSRMSAAIEGGSTADIYVNDRKAVFFDLGVEMDYFNFNSLSWGDPDGLNDSRSTRGSQAGYIGLANARIDDISVDGVFFIQNLTIEEEEDENIKQWYSLLRKTGQMAGNSYCRIGLDDMNVAIERIDVDVRLGPTKSLSYDDGASTLGSLHFGGLKVTNVNGTVDLFQH